MPKITFWYMPGACSIGPHIALHETGLQFEAIEASINMSHQIPVIPEEFRKINPKMRVPVLSLDDQIITEAPAVLLAISTLAPEMKLFGSTPMENVRVVEWLNWLSGTLHSQGFGPLYRPERYSDNPDIYETLKKQAKVNIARFLHEIDGKLTGEFAVGNSFTVVDAFLFPFWRWAKHLGLKMEEDYPRYTALVRRTCERDSARTSVRTEKLTLEQFGFVTSKV